MVNLRPRALLPVSDGRCPPWEKRPAARRSRNPFWMLVDALACRMLTYVYTVALEGYGISGADTPPSGRRPGRPAVQEPVGRGHGLRGPPVCVALAQQVCGVVIVTARGEKSANECNFPPLRSV